MVNGVEKVRNHGCQSMKGQWHCLTPTSDPWPHIGGGGSEEKRGKKIPYRKWDITFLQNIHPENNLNRRERDQRGGSIRRSRRPHLRSEGVKIYILGANLIWGFGWLRLALFEVQTSVFHGGWEPALQGDGRQSEVVGSVCTWGPAGYNTPVEL